MLSLQDLQRAYIKLYKKLREYIWNVSTVEDIAELEVAVYNRFPDIHAVRSRTNKLRSDIRDVINTERSQRNIYADDYTLEDAINDFEELINSEDSNEIYSPLVKVMEVSYSEDKEIKGAGSRIVNNNSSSESRSDNRDIHISGEIHRRN